MVYQKNNTQEQVAMKCDLTLSRFDTYLIFGADQEMMLNGFLFKNHFQLLRMKFVNRVDSSTSHDS